MSSSRNRNFDKYDLYQKSVQAPDTDVAFFEKVYREHRKKSPVVLREDFCGTFLVCCEWVKLKKNYVAYGLDLDPEPLQYGNANNIVKLNDQQRGRIHILQKNVLASDAPQADVIVAQNFSYYFFKSRDVLLHYFRQVLKKLNKDGVFIVDSFGGPACHSTNEDSTAHRGFTYFWEQKSWNPITHEAKFSIHYKMKGQKKRQDVFTYDWRMWTIPEIREVMREAGFKKTTVYWEGTTSKGTGDGHFKMSESGDDCDAWVAYIVGIS